MIAKIAGLDNSPLLEWCVSLPLRFDACSCFPTSQSDSSSSCINESTHSLVHASVLRNSLQAYGSYILSQLPHSCASSYEHRKQDGILLPCVSGTSSLALGAAPQAPRSPAFPCFIVACAEHCVFTHAAPLTPFPTPVPSPSGLASSCTRRPLQDTVRSPS